ncbi:MAG: MlaD family protein [Planctomycetes bacterium]|nr:MlaD family protein [Planctomycetota bacterium]
MNDRRMEFRVGVVVFATVIVGGLLATVYDPLPTGWLPWGRATYRIGIALPEAPGIGPNSPVRKNGILIGRVNSIEDKGEGVVVQTDVETDRPLLTNQVPHVRTSVLGDATIDFVTSPSNVPPQPLADGAVIPGVVAPHPLEAIAKLGDLQEDFAAASRALERAGNEVGDLAARINKAFGDETDSGRVTRLLDTTEQAMSQFAQTMTAMNEIIGDVPVEVRRPDVGQPPAINQLPGVGQPPVNQPPVNGQPAPVGPAPIEGQEMRRRIRQGLYEMPDAVREARITMQQFRGTLELADKNLRNLEGFTEPLGEKGGEIAATLIKAVEGLDVLVQDFTVLVRALNNREGTIGRLIHDAQVYENLNRLMCNANTVLIRVDELVRSLRPIRDDVRAFTDKIGREPGRIISGAVNPSLTK